jgi:spermidine/putrescine transport system permease protein
MTAGTGQRPGLAVRAVTPAGHGRPPAARLRARARRVLPKGWLLRGITWAYLAWSLLPILVAILFSFNAGKSEAVLQGLSLRWYVHDPLNSVLHNPQLRQAVVQTLRLALLTTVITVPIGVMFAVGIDRWRSKVSSAAGFVIVLSFVVPELLLAVAIFFVLTELYTVIRLGTLAEVVGLVVWNLSWPAIIVRARLGTIGRSYEEAAADLGCHRLQAIRRVLLPLLLPAVFASTVLVFAGTVDDFVIVNQLSSSAATQPMSVLIYSQSHSGLGGPALNALATLMLVFSVLAALIGLAGYRWMTRGERGSGDEALRTVAGM